MKFFLLLHLFVVSFLLISCSKKFDAGPKTTEHRLMPEYHRIEASGSNNFTFVYDTISTTVSIEAGINLMPYIETVVENGTLFIKEKHNNIINEGKVYIKVPVSEIDQLIMRGSGNWAGGPIISNDHLEIRQEGSGNAVLVATAANANIKLDGSGNLNLNGEATHAHLYLNGSGNLKASNFLTETCNATVNGSGNCELYASESLTAHVNGSGNIKYWGNPATTNFSIDGSGKIIKMY